VDLLREEEKKVVPRRTNEPDLDTLCPDRCNSISGEGKQVSSVISPGTGSGYNHAILFGNY